jgi:hypothetical protein
MTTRTTRLHLPPAATFAALALAVFATGAHAISVDAKALARFDISFGQCEKQIPQMRGRRDEAWLSLWRTRADDSSRADLAKARKSGLYVAEHRRVLQAQAAGHAPAASSAIDQQCQALWAETQRVAGTKP